MSQATENNNTMDDVTVEEDIEVQEAGPAGNIVSDGEGTSSEEGDLFNNAMIEINDSLKDEYKSDENYVEV